MASVAMTGPSGNVRPTAGRWELMPRRRARSDRARERRARDGGVEVIVAVDVIGPVIVAVHVHGNDTVIVI